MKDATRDDGNMVGAPSATALRLQAFLLFNGQIAIVVTIIAILLGGAYLYPSTVFSVVILPYYTYALLLGREELKDGARWQSFSKNFLPFRLMRRFLDLKLVPAQELTAANKTNKSAQFILAVFPHGTNSDYRILMDGILDKVLPNSASRMRTLAASVLFRIPIVREIALWTGCIDARRSVVQKALSQGRSLLVLPGGQPEQIRTVHEKEIVYLMCVCVNQPPLPVGLPNMGSQSQAEAH